MEIQNLNSQISNGSTSSPPVESLKVERVEGQITMTEIQNLKTPGHLKKVASQICFGHWILAFGIYLYFGACIL